jgi:hypothetical protein
VRAEGLQILDDGFELDPFFGQRDARFARMGLGRAMISFIRFALGVVWSEVADSRSQPSVL